MDMPEIRIFFSWLLTNDVSRRLQQLQPDRTYDDDATLREQTGKYQQAWMKHEAKILKALTEALDIGFYKSVIDVACAPNIMPMSDPLIVSFRYSPDQFVDLLTHELCHVLLTDNTKYSVKSSARAVDLPNRWAELFGEHERTLLVHIPVHALCKFIYLDVLKEPSRLEHDMRDMAGIEAYRESWKYVNAHDYKQIIADLKADYDTIADLITRLNS